MAPVALRGKAPNFPGAKVAWQAFSMVTMKPPKRNKKIVHLVAG